MGDEAPVTIVSHAAVDIAVPPEVVWNNILDEYVEAKKFRDSANIEPIDDRCAVLGGYRMRLEHDGVIDERIVHFTERDEAARRLSIFADYRTVPAGGMCVYATYHAQQIPSGTRYAIDCHSRLNIRAAVDAAGTDIESAVIRMKADFDTALIAYLSSVKAALEGDEHRHDREVDLAD